MANSLFVSRSVNDRSGFKRATASVRPAYISMTSARAPAGVAHAASEASASTTTAYFTGLGIAWLPPVARQPTCQTARSTLAASPG